MKKFGEGFRLRALLTAAVLITAIPVLGQDSPESILPPGFGDPEPPPRAAPRPPRDRPTRDDEPEDLLPTTPDVSDFGDPDSDQPSRPSRPRPSGGSDGSSSYSLPPLPGVPGADAAKKDGEGDEDGLAQAPVLQDLPPQARRSITKIGILAIDDGDLGETAFGADRGPFLTHLMRKTDAPIASRWASITLRRALLSRVLTPAGVNGADFAAERAWLLLRMGEAESGRMLVQAVDADQYTPWMKTIAMQSALASADPAGMCPASEGHPAADKDGYWMMARAICSAFSGESSLAGALVDRVRDKDKAATIDVLLSEKVIGAAGNSRRSTTILWEDVDKLTAWRYGLATSTGVALPPALANYVTPRVQAWRARAPLLAPQDRTGDVETAAALGVFSSAALVDHYSLVSELAEQGSASTTKQIDLLEQAYGAGDMSARLSALASLWEAAGNDPVKQYVGYLASARAAALIPAKSDYGDRADQLVAAMMSAGLDVQASRWAGQVNDGGLGWALLAVGSPEKSASISAGSVSGFDPGTSGKRAQFLYAGLAGLGRLGVEDANDLAADLEVPVGRANAWTKAIDRAAQSRQPGTVALLVALGLQSDSWAKVSPAQLFHSILALRRVGLEAEARMIAAEAVMRS